MKVVHVTNCFPPGRENGVTIAIQNYINGLKNFCDVFLLAPAYSREKDENGILHVKTKVSHGYSSSCTLEDKILDKVRDTDIFHLHHPPFGFFGKGPLTRQVFNFAKKSRKKIVFHNHTRYDLYAAAYIPVAGTPLLKEIVSTFFKRKNVQYCNQCDVVISPSKSMKKLLEEWSVKAEIKVVPTFIKKVVDGDRRKIREEYSIGDEEFVFLYLGRLGKEKNVYELFKTIKGLPLRLLVVGDGLERKKLEKKFNGIYAGHVKNENIADYYAAADLYGTMSYSDTQSLVLEEAKNFGLPVVAINAVGNKDVVNNGVDGFLVNSKEEFRNTVERIIYDRELRKKLSKNALESSEKRVPLETAKKLYMIYAKLLIK